MSVTVCIPTAGTGSRLGEKTRYLNKSLMSVGYRPVLARLIDSFPEDAEFVIALGSKGDLVVEFLELAYPDRVFHFARVDPFEGPGSGLGLSLLACRDYLQKPFLFISCDTLVVETPPLPDHDWMGWAEREDLSAYRTLRLEDDHIEAVLEKGLASSDRDKAYIGLAGIAHYQEFWDAMASGGEEAIACGESWGFARLLQNGQAVKAWPFTWRDTGSAAGLEAADAAFRDADGPNILDKPDEAIWFVNGNVIKYSNSPTFIAQRVARAEHLKGYAPVVTGTTAHMYRYRKAEGDVFSKIVDPVLFRRLLAHSREFWAPKPPDDAEQFRKGCMAFYKDKTFERVNQFYTTFDRKDGTEPINGVPMPRLEELFAKMDWDWLADGLPGRFHGDFHFENILMDRTNERFTFLDWRQNFADSLETGDIYYDFAKLEHGLIVNHEIIAKNQFSAHWDKGEIRFDLMRRHALILCEQAFARWLSENVYDVRKVHVLTALIYLNIAALHHYPYCLLLYGLGKSMLFEQVGEGA
ncbi:hypothetical protein FACS1894205_1810 [Alphaproteobacteria bacterium]|nr:hypothetical protein FACS1894205_1810 [Alphaproteobacteria bacterium]